MYKNTASQKWSIFAFDRTDNTPKTGDAANITANLRIDGVQNAVDDTNPTELEDGYYEFDLTQVETNGSLLVICPASSTANIQVIGVPGAAWPILIAAGGGAVSWTYTLTEATTGNPIPGADVWATTDEAGTDVVASGVTDTSGEVTFFLDAADYYIWRQLSGWNFTNPDQETVSE